MRMIHCFRCGESVPGLEDEEDRELRALWKAACETERTQNGGLSAWELGRIARESPAFQCVRDRYSQVTGQELQTR